MSDPAAQLASSFPSTSSQLLHASLAGDAEAWRDFTAIYGRVVYQWLRRAGVASDDTLDVMQDVFLAVYRGLPTYNSAVGPFRNWLFILVRNAMVDHWRRANRQPRGEGGTTAWRRQLDLADPAAEEEQSVAAGTILRASLEVVRGRFESKSWHAACRVILDGQAAAVVALELGMSVPAVYTAKSRVLAAIREQLADLEDFRPPSQPSND